MLKKIVKLLPVMKVYLVLSVKAKFAKYRCDLALKKLERARGVNSYQTLKLLDKARRKHASYLEQLGQLA